jgi:hypothetical protein
MRTSLGLLLALCACGGHADAPPSPHVGVDCIVPAGSFIGCDGQSHSYAIGWTIHDPANVDAGLAAHDNSLSCWAMQVVDPTGYACATGNACDVWLLGDDGGVVHQYGSCR